MRGDQRKALTKPLALSGSTEGVGPGFGGGGTSTEANRFSHKVFSGFFSIPFRFDPFGPKFKLYARVLMRETLYGKGSRNVTVKGLAGGYTIVSINSKRSIKSIFTTNTYNSTRGSRTLYCCIPEGKINKNKNLPQKHAPNSKNLLHITDPTTHPAIQMRTISNTAFLYQKLPQNPYITPMKSVHFKYQSPVHGPNRLLCDARKNTKNHSFTDYRTEVTCNHCRTLLGFPELLRTKPFRNKPRHTVEKTYLKEAIHFDSGPYLFCDQRYTAKRFSVGPKEEVTCDVCRYVLQTGKRSLSEHARKGYEPLRGDLVSLPEPDAGSNHAL